jgi:RHS repeat-associated protein
MFDPYGRVTVLDGNGTPRTVNESMYGNPWTFTGRRLDGETGLMYFRNRMYETGLGRFIGRDPLGYVDGMGLQGAYFVPHGVDPKGTIGWKRDEKKCEITLFYKIQVKGQAFNNLNGAMQADFLKRMETPVEASFNGSAFRIFPQKGKFLHGWLWSRYHCCNVCLQGWTPKLDVIVVQPGRWSNSEDLEVEVTPRGSRAGVRGGVLGLFPVDIGSNDFGQPSGPQNTVAHEVGHGLSLKHPGSGLPGYNPNDNPSVGLAGSEYAHTGLDIIGRQVSGNDLMGLGASLRKFYFEKWVNELDIRYPQCSNHFVR